MTCYHSLSFPDVNGKLSNGDTINQTIMSNLRIGNISVGSSSGSGQCPSVDSGIPGSTTFMSPGPDDFQTDLIKTIVIDYRTSLGISICGGVNDVNGPNVYIAEVIPGGDVHHVRIVVDPVCFKVIFLCRNFNALR